MTATLLARDVLAPPSSRRGRYTETPEYARMTARIVRGLGRRVSAGDLAELPTLAAIAAEADRILRETARALHDDGYSWTEIGRELGITKQSAFRKFTRTTGQTGDPS